MAGEKTLFINESTIAAYKAGMAAEREHYLGLLQPIFNAFAREEHKDQPLLSTLLSATIISARAQCVTNTPEQRVCAAGFIAHDHDELGPRLE
jgi:hypothetical protein